MVKNLPSMQGTWVQSLGQEDPLEEEMATQVFLPGNSVDKGDWWATVHGVAESDMTKQLTQKDASVRVGDVRELIILCTGFCCESKTSLEKK